jgi:hypothetical protein
MERGRDFSIIQKGDKDLAFKWQWNPPSGRIRTGDQNLPFALMQKAGNTRSLQARL